MNIPMDMKLTTIAMATEEKPTATIRAYDKTCEIIDGSSITSSTDSRAIRRDTHDDQR